VLENIEKEYLEFNEETITLKQLDPHQSTWKGLFRSKEILKSNFNIFTKSRVDHVRSINMATAEAKKFIRRTNYAEMRKMEDRTAIGTLSGMPEPGTDLGGVGKANIPTNSQQGEGNEKLAESETAPIKDGASSIRAEESHIRIISLSETIDASKIPGTSTLSS